MQFNTEPVNTYYLIRWPDDRRGLSLGIVKSICCKRVFRELYRIYGRRKLISYLKVWTFLYDKIFSSKMKFSNNIDLKLQSITQHNNKTSCTLCFKCLGHKMETILLSCKSSDCNLIKYNQLKEAWPIELKNLSIV